jgi:retrograde regulation protein 2
VASNGIRFSISDLSEPRGRLLPCIYRERADISLYDALHESAPDSKPFYFSPKTISAVSETLVRFRYICDRYGVPVHQISVFATEATRTAENKDDLLEAIKSTSGLVVEILSPAMESLFGAMGARSGFHQVDGLFMDLGGGSVQMTYVNSKFSNYDVLAARAAQSIPYGAAKLTASMSNQGQSFSKQDLQQVMEKTFSDLESQFEPLQSQVKSSGGITIYFCGGGFRGYGSMLMHTHEVQPYPIPFIGGFAVSGARFAQWQDMLKANEHKGKIFGMSKRRRTQFLAIAMVVEALVNAIPHIKQVVFCSGGNREGVLYMKLPSTIRESSPLPLLSRGSESESVDAVDMIVNIFSQALPDASPSIFNSELQHYFVQNIWLNMGDPDNVNSVKALHNPISGIIAGLPGLTHKIRAILALTLCARWGTDIGPVDRVLFENLRRLVGPHLSFWCEYLGAVARLLATIVPAFPSDRKILEKTVSFVFLQSCLSLPYSANSNQF